MSSWDTFLTNAKRNLNSQCTSHRILIDRILLEIPVGSRVLEAGCGHAYLSKILADIGYKVTAGDLDTSVLKSAQSEVQFLKNPIDYKQIDLLKLSQQFEPNSIDVITHSGVLEHFTDEMIETSLKEQRKVARCLIFKIPNSRSVMTKEHFGDERFLSNQHWLNLLQKSGYSHVQVYGGETLPRWTYLLPHLFLMTPMPGKSKKLNQLFSFFSGWRRFFSRHTIFVCRS